MTCPRFQWHGKANRLRFSKEKSGIKNSRFTDDPSIGFLKLAEAGAAVKDPRRKRVSDAS
jgi:hypothetical protein